MENIYFYVFLVKIGMRRVKQIGKKQYAYGVKTNEAFINNSWPWRIHSDISCRYLEYIFLREPNAGIVVTFTWYFV